MMSEGSSKSGAFTSFLSLPTITTEKLVGSDNYASWAGSVELWFIGQGLEDHLITTASEIEEKNRTNWIKTDALLCSLLW